MSRDRETFGNETFEIKIEDTHLYGTYSYSLKVRMIDSGVSAALDSNTTEANSTDAINIDEEFVNEAGGRVFEVTLDSAPFAKYAD